MEQKSESLKKSALISGLYTGILLILVAVIIYVADLTFEKWTSYPSYLVLILGVIWAQIKYRKKSGGEMPYSKALGVGFLTVVFAGILSGIYIYILNKVIDPSLIEQTKLLTEQKLVEQGNFTEEQINTTMSIQSKFLTPAIMAVSGIFWYVIIGFIISLITAIFTKKETQNY